LDELEARVRALARRPASAPSNAAPLAFGGLASDPQSAAIYLQGVALDLTARECKLLRALLVRPGHAVAKDKLSSWVFAGDSNTAGAPHTQGVSVQADAIEVVVYRLRKKLVAQHAPVELVTLRGLGYLLKSTA
jgi:two-component system, OmpR family, response regulator TctD